MANKIDFKAAATKMAGHAAGAAAYTQLNKLKFMQSLSKDPKTGLVLDKPTPIKGLVTALIGYIAVPMIAEKMKIAGRGKKGEFIQHIGEGMGMIGVMQAANALAPGTTAKPALFPMISGVDDDNSVQGLGMISEEDDGVSGYETNPMRVGELSNSDANDNNVNVRY